MIKGLMMTPPVVGRISIGRVVERNGKRLPEKDDEFTITTQVQSRNGWMLHPLDGILRRELEEKQKKGAEITQAFAEHKEPGPDESVAEAPAATLRSKLAKRATGGVTLEERSPEAIEQKRITASPEDQTKPSTARVKLRCIPVKVLFNDPDLNLRANYTLFDRATARPLCVGDGQTCKRVTDKGIESLQCQGPDICALAIDGGCKPFGRFHMRVDHRDNQADALSTFVLRTTGINSMRSLLTRMQYLQAVSGGLLAYLPLEIRLRAKSTAMSRRTPIYYVDIGLREGVSLEIAIGQATVEAEHAKRVGQDQDALERAARAGYALGLFEELSAEAAEIVEEFYPDRSELGGVE